MNDKYVVEVRPSPTHEWREHFSANVKDVDQDEFKIFVRVYAKLFWPEKEYRVVHRSEFVLGVELPASGKWRIQIKYNDNTSKADRFFDNTPGFSTWGDINVMKSEGYTSYDEAFNALKKFDFEKHNPTFVWRIVQD